MTIWERLRGGLIVSCQALSAEPLYGSDIMAAMARAAAEGGAVGIRANSPADISAVRAAVALPIIGLFKDDIPGLPVYITPTWEHALAVAEAGADIVAADATLRPHARGEDGPAYVRILKERLRRPVLAEISTLEEGLAAEEAGADAVSTTLAGYTSHSRQSTSPDFELIEELVCAVHIPVVAEGRIWTPEEAREALERGAHCVVVGTAITRPQCITARFVRAMREGVGKG